jgi:hypothetical protein
MQITGYGQPQMTRNPFVLPRQVENQAKEPHVGLIAYPSLLFAKSTHPNLSYTRTIQVYARGLRTMPHFSALLQ